ncbi:MAG: extracellular solute-binding protein [Lachnospiraceae bacterium]|nr:extracellular solute-binding protein [Lachnospiraceae bacterium]
MRMKRFMALMIVSATLLGAVSGCSSSGETAGETDRSAETDAEGQSGAQGADVWELAATDPYAPYPETVNYTIGVTVDPSRTYPEDWENGSPEHSAYTEFYMAKLNVQNTDYFEATDGDDYRTKVSMAISSGDLPDIMSVTHEELVALVENDLVEDLTDAYNNCASDLMKEIYDSYEGRSLEMATFDGRLYAMPTTNISGGPEFLWLRKDWMDKLGLEEPKTLEDVEAIVTAFVEQDPGNNGVGKTVGIPLCTTESNFLYGSYSSAYKMNNVFTMYGACPEQWIETAGGNVEYGSVQPEMKEGLAVLADWYQKGLIDKEFSTRKYSEVTSLITDGRCGSVFAGWWLPYDLGGCYELNPDAEWVSYLLPTSENGKVTAWTGNPNQEVYFVVKKGFEHPELLVKIKSLTLDYNQGDAAYTDDSAEAAAYMEWVNHGYGIEFIGGFDWYDAVARSYTHIKEAIDGTRDPQNMTAYENSLYESCQAYLASVEAGEQPDKQNWIDYNCRMVAAKQMLEADTNTVNPVFFGQTESMGMMWETLRTLERKTIMQIVTGELPLEAFDTFVEEWKEAGGDIITAEVNEQVNQ